MSGKYKTNAQCSPEQLEKRLQQSRARNAKYLASGDDRVAQLREKNHDAYLGRLASDTRYTEQAADRRAKAVKRTAAWQKTNPEAVAAHAKAGRQRHPDREAAKVQRRNAAKLRATPPWANREAINRHYANARYLTKVTGFVHHVDHIIPLRSKLLCGLHVEHNLRVIPHYLNTRKGNRLLPGL